MSSRVWWAAELPSLDSWNEQSRALSHGLVDLESLSPKFNIWRYLMKCNPRDDLTEIWDHLRFQSCKSTSWFWRILEAVHSRSTCKGFYTPAIKFFVARHQVPTLPGAVARPDRAGTGVLQCFMVVVDSLCRQFLHNKLPTKSHVVADHVSMYDIRSTRDS